eukprot:1153748-Pelagomonas_calceolata.AAC.7
MAALFPDDIFKHNLAFSLGFFLAWGCSSRPAGEDSMLCPIHSHTDATSLRLTILHFGADSAGSISGRLVQSLRATEDAQRQSWAASLPEKGVIIAILFPLPQELLLLSIFNAAEEATFLCCTA